MGGVSFYLHPPQSSLRAWLAGAEHGKTYESVNGRKIILQERMRHLTNNQ